MYNTQPFHQEKSNSGVPIDGVLGANGLQGIEPGDGKDKRKGLVFLSCSTKISTWN